jgi:hypothetical protein
MSRLRIVYKVLICLFPILPMSVNSDAFFIASLTDILNNTSMHFFSQASLLLLCPRYLGIPRKTPFRHYMTAVSSSGCVWHGCILMRNNVHATDNDMAQFALKAWFEIDSEVALNKRNSAVERAFLFDVGRTYHFRR